MYAHIGERVALRVKASTVRRKGGAPNVSIMLAEALLQMHLPPGGAPRASARFPKPCHHRQASWGMPLPCAQAKAVDEKGQGNRAFAAKEYQQAVVHFSKCIELDPECALSAFRSPFPQEGITARVQFLIQTTKLLDISVEPSLHNLSSFWHRVVGDCPVGRGAAAVRGFEKPVRPCSKDVNFGNHSAAGAVIKIQALYSISKPLSLQEQGVLQQPLRRTRGNED